MSLRSILTRVGVYPEEGLRSVGRLVTLATLVGVVSGAGAVVFHMMCLFVTHYALAAVAGYEQGGPANEKEWSDLFVTEPIHRAFSPWLLLLVIGAGGLVSGLLVYFLAPEAEGHGTDSAIDAYHNKRGLIPLRVSIVKMFSSAITLGTGGSGGREGPIAQIGAGFGSYLATRLGLSPSERRALLAAGLGAGIGAIFHAPLAGAIFACEVLYRELDFESENLIPAFIATAVAYSVFSIPFGHEAFGPLFAVSPDLAFTRPLPLLLPLAGLALSASMAALLFVRMFYMVHRGVLRLPLARPLRPFAGAVLTGVVGLVIYYAVGYTVGKEWQHDSLSVLSYGYGFLQRVLQDPASLPIGLLVMVGVGKMLTTSLTIGMGGSGGLFGPSMMAGGTLGAVVGLVFHRIMPGIVQEQDIVVFAILGMAAFFSSAANTPISSLIMVTEMTSSYVLLLPSMWVCALAYLVSRGWTLYEKQVSTRRDSPAHRGDFIIDVLKGLTVRDAIGPGDKQFLTVPLDTPLSQMAKLITDTRQATFPVVDGEGRYYGAFGLNDIRQFIYEQGDLAELAVAQDLSATHQPLTLSMELSEAISLFKDDELSELPVVDSDEPDRVIGLMTRHELIAAYSARLLAMRSDESLVKAPTL